MFYPRQVLEVCYKKSAQTLRIDIIAGFADRPFHSVVYHSLMRVLCMNLTTTLRHIPIAHFYVADECISCILLM